MILMRKPSGSQLKAFIEQQAKLPLSYPEVEATRGPAPSGYAADQHRIQLGWGQETFQRARRALMRWRMFELSWVQLCWPNVPVQPGNTVGVLAHVTGSWWLNACRVVYTFEEGGEVERLGFAYGTLPDHAARGEERFQVEWQRSDESVWYEVLAYSQLNHRLARLGGRLTRRTQQRFAADSLQAMERAVRGGLPEA